MWAFAKMQFEKMQLIQTFDRGAYSVSNLLWYVSPYPLGLQWGYSRDATTQNFLLHVIEVYVTASRVMT